MPTRLIIAITGLLLMLSGAPARAGAFGDWTAVIVAGDWRGSGGGATEAFDNARRDVAQALTRVGFQPGNLRQFSTRPERYRDTAPAKAELEQIYGALEALAPKATGGCLFYITTHGTPQGAVVDKHILAPGVLAAMLDRTCGKRPTVVVVSACFSGVFVPQLAGPNRMVLTAARPDRTSFGCGETDKYPYFDDCFLSTIGQSAHFQALATATRECVRRREIAEKVSPPSEPQVFVGPELRPVLPLYAF
ncbi:C13 family peptidase [Phenylobacterium sp. J426]|uniref:C13 family peptidase n=1 Tax=Phenylobacterium sp. J426 TaxID=2898439 RepID=UPI002150B43F|nr:C13 family peptidase [Phenylobacterium sp. J426]MCR5874847.1 C13 family peptidase [Phenylobacterium sp. J426]